MFVVIRAAIRAFAVGVVVGVLFAPRAGVLTRKMVSERFASGLNELLEIAALPPIPPERARTNGHSARPSTRRIRAGTDARAS